MKVSKGLITKNVFLMTLVCILLFVAACGSSESTTGTKETAGGATEASGDSANASGTNTKKKKYKIFLNLSYSGNSWSNEAANIIESLAKTPPYDEMVEFTKIISGADAQKQISDIQSMVAAGADAIISYPISPKALNGVVEQACSQGVKMFFYDSGVTHKCAYNVSYITAGQGQNTAQYLVNLLGGKGKIFMNRGVAGTGVDMMQYEGAMSVFKKYPGIEIVSEYYSNWDQVQSKTNTLKALAAHPDVDGIWSQDGEYGAIQALQQTGHKMIPVVGENSNGFRNALLELKDQGLQGVSGGSAPAVGGYAFKLAMELLTGSLKESELPHNIEYPLPWVPSDKVKTCDGNEFKDGCNSFPTGRVPSSFVTEVFDPVLVPEISLVSALNAIPTGGMTIQPIPKDAIKEAPSVPDINCEDCQSPADLFKVNEALVKPIPVP